MEIIFWFIILSGPILYNTLDDFQQVEHDTSCKLDKIFKNISHKYDERKYLGTFAAYMISVNTTSTYHLLLLLANDINPNPGPISQSEDQLKLDIVSYTRDQLLNFRFVNDTISQNLHNTINEIIIPYSELCTATKY